MLNLGTDTGGEVGEAFVAEKVHTRESGTLQIWEATYRHDEAR